MHIEIYGKNYKVNEKLANVLQKKVRRLEKYFDDDAVCTVFLKQEAKFVKTEITISYKGNIVRAEAATENFYDGIDEVLPRIERQIYKYKTKIASKLKKDAFAEKQMFFADADIEPSKLVKTKTFDLVPMTTEEAVEQLDMLGHTFYIFQDAETGEVRAVYLRQSGDVGLLVPRKAK